MSDSIRKQIFDAIETKIAEVLKSNGYNTDCGQNPYQGAVEGLEVPFINFGPLDESSVVDENAAYGMDSRTVRINIESAVDFSELDVVGDPVEQMLADLIEVVAGKKYVIAFTSGGNYVIRPGHTVTGADSSATAFVESVSVSSGSWATGTAAGNITLRRKKGIFTAENLNVGSNLNVCTVTGSLTTSNPEVTTTGGLAGNIQYIGGGARSYPEAGDNVVGCFAEFNILFYTLIGDPYNQ